MNVTKLLMDWERFCEGEGGADDCHFLGLFKSGLDAQELKRALRYFTSSGQVEERLLGVLGAGYLGDSAYLQRPPMKDVSKTRHRGGLRPGLVRDAAAALHRFGLQQVLRLLEARRAWRADGYGLSDLKQGVGGKRHERGTH